MIHQRHVILAPADVLALNSTPYRIPIYDYHAPSGFGYVSVVGAAFLYRFNGTPYTMSGEVNLYYGNDLTSPLLGNGVSLETIDLSLTYSFPAFVNGRTQKSTPPNVGVGLTRTDIDENVVLWADTADPADGDGDLMVVVYWAELGLPRWDGSPH